MGTLVDYIVMRDTKIILSRDEETGPPLQCPLPSNFFIDNEGHARVVLSYVIEASGGSNRYYEIDVNDVVVLHGATSERTRVGLSEVINGEKFRAGQNNTVQFRFEKGSGEIAISDIVLWFQRTV